MKMWDGRFAKPSSELMEKFNNSLPVDKALITEDIKGSIAWARALGRIGVLSGEETKSVTEGLGRILEDYYAGKIEFSSHDEDVHMAVERILIERIGDAGARLHTGRSRNDQVATDFRLFVMRKMAGVYDNIVRLQTALVFRAEKDIDIIVPSFTHLQQAQPVSLAHYWLSFFFELEREKKRTLAAIDSTDYMPLGSGAVAGCGFHVDRVKLAEEIGFKRITDNSMDGVASRDFVLEALSVIASIGIHCSRFAEDLIIWSSREFGFVELDDAWSTGSSMMPQKKNPDSLELIRGKSGRFLGNYTRFATTLKGVGLTYYKDLQEDKEPFIDSIENIMMVLEVFSEVIATLTVREKRIAEDLDPFLLATDLADYMVRKNVPFRVAHKAVGKIVAWCIENKRDMMTLTVEDLRPFCDAIEEDVLDIFDWNTALNHRDIAGGTGRSSIMRQLEKANKLLDE